MYFVYCLWWKYTCYGFLYYLLYKIWPKYSSIIVVIKQRHIYSTWLKNVNNKNITSNNQRIIWQAHLLGCILLHIAFVPIMIFHLNLFFYQLLTTWKLCLHIFVPNSLQNGHFQFCSSYTCHIVPCRHPHFNLCTMKLFFSSFIKMF